MSAWRHLVLYDAECGLCDRAVQWILQHDTAGVITFAPLQGSTAHQLLRAPTLDTVVLVERRADGAVRIHERSRAVFHVWAALGGAWRALSWLRFVPAVVTDIPYRIFARNRIRWFGRPDACRVPDAATRARFLA